MDLSAIVITAIVLLVLYILYDYLYDSGRYWKDRKIPCIAGALPLVGNMWPLVTFQETFSFMYHKFYNQMTSSMFGIYKFRTPVLVIRDPEIVKTILIGSFYSFSENTSKLDSSLDPLLSTNPFFTHGDEWKSQRAVLHNALTTKQLKVMSLQIDDVCRKFKEFLSFKVKESDEVVQNCHEMCSRFTAEVVAAAGFGIDGKSFTDDPHSFWQEAKVIFDPTKYDKITGYLDLFLLMVKDTFQLRFLPQALDRHFRQILRAVVPTRKESRVNDFLQQIMEASDEQTEKTDENFLVGHAASFFLDGYVTSSLMMGFTCYHIAAYPNVQEKIRSEVTEVLAKSNGKVTFESLQEMHYLEQVINESMRLYPGIATIGKVCTKECKLVGSDGLEYTAEPGTEIAISIIGLHRNPKYWENPDEFNPDRFNEANRNYQNRYVYIPFGAGPRICVGRKPAMLQIKAALATLVHSFSLEVDSRTKEPVTVHPMSALFTLPKDSIWIRIKSLM